MKLLKMTMKSRLLNAALLLACTGCHTNSLAFDDEFECKNVISYYWPLDSAGNDDTKSWSVKNVSTIDLLNSVEHGDDVSRNHWRAQNVNFASRVHPFRFFESVSDNLTYFEENITIDNILSIDELVAHNWSKERKDDFLYLLSIFKDNHPEVKLILWDASLWEEIDYDYASAVYSNVDLVLIQHYTNRNTELEKHLLSLNNKLALYRDKLSKNTRVGIAIGTDPRESEKSTDGSMTWAEINMIETAKHLDSSNLENVGLYAPIYLSSEALRNLDEIYSDASYENCTLFSTS